jgi:hypothetical protein
MPHDDTRTLRRNSHVEPLDDVRRSDGPSPLLAQAAAWTDVARQANDDCVKGEDAEKEMEARRNEPGQ